MTTKREEDLRRFEKMEDLLACPICAEPLHVQEDLAGTLMCERRHTFDIAREGYVNLVTTHRRKASGYGQTELAARRRMLQKGLFAPLVQHIAENIRENIKKTPGKPLRVVDVGTGEGTVFSAILRELIPSFPKVEGCGTDISVAGIRMAGKLKNDIDIVWVVGNALRPLPFQDHSTAVVLSILAPITQEEAARIVTPGGCVVVVTPGEHHLRELREAIFENKRKSPLEKPFAQDARSPLTPGATLRIQHTTSVALEDTDDLIYMSPLFWKASRIKLDQLRERRLEAITVDFEINGFLPRKED